MGTDVDLVNVAEVEVVGAEVGFVHFQLVGVDVVGEEDFPVLFFECEADEADAREEFGGGERLQWLGQRRSLAGGSAWGFGHVVRHYTEVHAAGLAAISLTRAPLRNIRPPKAGAGEGLQRRTPPGGGDQLLPLLVVLPRQEEPGEVGDLASLALGQLLAEADEFLGFTTHAVALSWNWRGLQQREN